MGINLKQKNYFHKNHTDFKLIKNKKEKSMKKKRKQNIIYNYIIYLVLIITH